MPVMRTLLSTAATLTNEGRKRALMIADIKTAFLYGDARRALFIELPPEDPSYDGGKSIGRLKRSLYGTRDAPMIWSDHLRETLEEIGFKDSLTSPGFYHHPSRHAWLCVHVDDLVVAGPCDELVWLVV